MADHDDEQPRPRRRRSDRSLPPRAQPEPRSEPSKEGADQEATSGQPPGADHGAPAADEPAARARRRRRTDRADLTVASSAQPAPSASSAQPAPPAKGRRAAAAGTARREGRGRLLIGVIGLTLVAVVVVLLVSGWLGRAMVDDDDGPDVVSEVGAAQPTLTLITVEDAAGAREAARLSVLAHDRPAAQGTVLLLPTTTIADVPGHGTFSLGEAHELGGASLIGVTVANLLGIGVDGTATISTAGWVALLDTLGSVEVTVRTQLSAPDGSVRFEPGEQVLAGERLAEYLTMTAAGETELDALPRVQQVLGAVLDAVGRDPALVERWLTMELADGSPVIATDAPELVRAVLLELAEARSADDVTTWTLPVVPLGSGRDDGYRLDVRRSDELVADRFGASLPGTEVAGGRDVEILNGNGVPRVGQEVAERLSDGGYRIVLTGNADRFTYETTRIVLHDRSPAQLAVGRDVQARLGVGELELAATPGSVVDVTIVVGADFPPEAG
jgi:polyisoprenyl-teichoic acid--peptidoglycan teichoic acid transferase